MDQPLFSRAAKGRLAAFGVVSAAALALAVTLGAGASPAAGKGKIGVAGKLVVAGETMDVRWTDGDTLAIDSGSLAKKKVRLAGFNALEAYGPVHRWGTWKPAELYELAQSAGAAAAAGVWTCTVGGPDGGTDGGYGRILLDCPDAARALIGAGLAHVFAVEHPADPALLAVQAEAQKARAGMWAKGVPALLITSVHSADEGKDPYNRVCDTRTGAADRSPHSKAYTTCEEVCVGPAGGESCMIYVPFDHRYRDRPGCLR